MCKYNDVGKHKIKIKYMPQKALKVNDGSLKLFKIELLLEEKIWEYKVKNNKLFSKTPGMRARHIRK